MLDHAPSAHAKDKYPTLRGKRILVVEDDALIAVDYHFQLREVGAQPQAYEPQARQRSTTSPRTTSMRQSSIIACAMGPASKSSGPCGGATYRS